MPIQEDVFETGLVRSPSPSAAQRAVREQLRFLRQLTGEEEELHVVGATAASVGGSGQAFLYPGQSLHGLVPAPSSRGRRPGLPPRNLLETVPSSAADEENFSNSDVQQVLTQLRAFQEEWVQRSALSRQPLPDLVSPLIQPAPCAFLRPGQTFSGSQRVMHWSPRHGGAAAHSGEEWTVTVTLQDYDHPRGRVNGLMTAENVPEAAAPVVTFFQGEIVDNANSSFFTPHTDWAASADTDLRHWARFPAFRALQKDVETLGGRAPGLEDCGTIFMRWKEQYFVNGGECRLTIAGFYFLALDRATGDIQAFYFDPASSPDQRLELKACAGGECGHSFPACELA